MKNKVFSLLLASLMMTGASVMTSCSNDDEDIAQPEQTQDTAMTPSQEFNDAISALNQEMAGLDFKDLAPLDTRLSENEGAEPDANKQQFNSWLQQILQQLNQDFSHKLPFGFTLGFEAVEDALSMMWTVSSLNSFGKEEGHSWLMNSDTMTISANYTVRNGSVYHVTLEEIIEKEGKNQTAVHSKERKLTIVKGEEPLLSIKAGKVNEVKFIGLMPSKRVEYTGEIDYKEYTIGLGYDRASSHNRILELSVDKEGSNLVKATTTVTDNATLLNILKHDAVFASDYAISLMSDMVIVDGKVNNINKLIANAVLFLGLRKSGISEGLCNDFTKLYNENMTATLNVAGSEMGKIIASPAFSEKLGKYVPSLFIVSPLFGDEPVDVTIMLSNFGISIDDILGNIMGGKEQE